MTSFDPPVEIAAWLACLTFVVWLFNGAAKAWFTLRGKPTPQEQADRASGIAERVGSLEACAVKCRQESERRFASIENEQVILRAFISTEINNVYKRINSIADDTSHLRGEVGAINDNLKLVLAKFINRR